MTNTPDILLRAMDLRRAAGLFVEVVEADREKFIAAGGGVLSIYAKDADQRDRYCADLERMGVRYTVG